MYKAHKIQARFHTVNSKSLILGLVQIIPELVA